MLNMSIQILPINHILVISFSQLVYHLFLKAIQFVVGLFKVLLDYIELLIELFNLVTLGVQRVVIP